MKARMTIEYLEPAPDGTVLEPFTLEFDYLHIQQHRPVHRVFDPLTGQCKLTPDRMTTTEITGTRMAPPA